MEWTTFYISSVTNAMRGKSLLEKQGYTVRMQRSFGAQDGNGCGYRLLVKGDRNRAKDILVKAGLRIVKITNGGHDG